jgi:hypothetical protein
MEDKNALVETFNVKLTEFARDLLALYPKDADVATFKTSVSMALVVDPRKAERMFHKFVTIPYGDALLARDESVFVNPGLLEAKIQTMADVDTSVDFTETLLAKLRSYWADMSENDHLAVWNYFKILVLLSRKLRSD